MIKEKIVVSDGSPKFVGGFCDIWCGMYEGGPVAVRTMRIYASQDLEEIRKVNIVGIFTFTNWHAVSIILSQKFYKEVILWERLSHPNILKLVGVQEDMKKGRFTTVSEWMAHGTILNYIEKNPANRLELVCGFTFPTVPMTEML